MTSKVKAYLFKTHGTEPELVYVDPEQVLKDILKHVGCKYYEAIDLDPLGEKPGIALCVDEMPPHHVKANEILAKYPRFSQIRGNALLMNECGEECFDITEEDLKKYFPQ